MEDNEFKDYVKQQFDHGRKHFERLEKDLTGFHDTLSKHAEVFNSMNEGVLEGVNERAAYVDVLMEKSKFWSDIRDELTRRSVMTVFICLVAGTIFIFGFEDVAKKLIGLE